MALKKDKPNHPRGNEDSDPLGHLDGSHDDVSLNDREKAAAAGLEKQAKAPAIADKDRNTKSPDRQESDALSKDGGFYKKSKPGKRMSKVKKWAVAAGISGGITLGMGLGMFSTVHGPLQIIHVSQLLKQIYMKPIDEFISGRTVRNLYYVKTGQAEKTRMGVLRNYYADKIETRMRNKKGIKSAYHPRTGRFLGYDVIDSNKAKGFIDEVKGKKGVRITGDRIDLVDTSARIETNIIKHATRVYLPAELPRGLSARTMTRRADTSFKHLKDRNPLSRQNRSQFINALKQYWNLRRKHGSAGALRYLRDIDWRRGGEIDQDSNDLKKVAESADTPDRQKAFRKKMLSGARAGGMAFAVLTFLVSLGEISDNIIPWQYAKQLLPTLRTANEVMSAGDQVAGASLVHPEEQDAEDPDSGTATTLNPFALDSVSAAQADEQAQDEEGGSLLDGDGDQVVSIAELDAYREGFSVENEDGEVEGWYEAAPLLAEMGHEPNSKQRNTAKEIGDMIGGSGTKPAFFVAYDQFRNSPGVKPLLFATEKLLDAGNWVLEKIGAQAVIDSVVRTVLGWFNTSQEELFDSMMAYLVGSPLCNNATGPQLGICWAFGSVLSANEQFTGLGARQLTDQEHAAIAAETRESIRLENQSKSFVARMFDIGDVNSFASTSLREMPKSPKTMVASLLNLPSTIASAIAKPVSAQNSNAAFDYGIPRFGYSIAEQSNPAYHNPYANAAIVEPKLPELNEKYAECFGAEVVIDGDEPELRIISTPDSPAQILPYAPEIEGSTAECPNRQVAGASTDGKVLPVNTTEFLQYRYYLADIQAQKILACSQGHQLACDELYGLNVGAGGAGPPGSNAELGIDGCPNGPVGIGETVVVEGFRVHKCIANNVKQMIAAADEDGLDLRGGSAWRDPQRQKELYEQNCPGGVCSTPTAKPGNSMHERGLAIDFSDMCFRVGGNPSCPGNPRWEWLRKNASKFGLKQLSSESWHWSTNGR